MRQPAAHAIDARADFVGRFVEVRAPREVQADRARAFRRRRVDLLEARHRRERLLERPHDELFDFGRSDAAVADAHRDARIGHVRHQVDRQPEQRDRAEQHDDRREHEHRDRALNRERGMDIRLTPAFRVQVARACVTCSRRCGAWRRLVGLAAAAPARARRPRPCRRAPRPASPPTSDAVAVAQRERAGGDDALAFVEALEDLDALAVRQARLDFA